MPATIGRDPELEAVERLLDGGSARLTALVLEGEPGIGKTTVWRDAVDMARERGCLVLTGRPAQAETTLAFASLADLLEPISDRTIAALPGPQRHALEVALLRAGPRAVAAQGRAVAAGVVSLLRVVARSQPLLLGIDDVQWLDPSSAAALSFALRRLGDERLAVLLSRRNNESSNADVLGLETEFPHRFERMHLGPLNLGALYHLIRNHLGVSYPRPMLQRIERASGGNPLYAIELARAYEALDRRPGPGEPLPMGRLVDLIDVRIAALPAMTRQALLAVASMADATDGVVAGAVGARALISLGQVVRAGLIERDEGHIRFAHPLYAGAVVAAAPRDERLAMHRRLADIIDDPEEKALHLALGSDAPDEDVAAALESAAGRVAKRGAPAAAGELLDLAIRKTPPSDPIGAARRRVELVELTMRAGESEKAERLVAMVLDSVSEGSLRARALEKRARINFTAGTASAAIAACDEALREPDLGIELQARIHATRSIVGVGDDVADAERDALNALDLLAQVEAPDPVVEVEAIQALIGVMVWQGRPLPVDLVERGLELERAAPNPVVADRLSAAIGARYKYAGDFPAARHWLELTHRAAIDEGDEGSMPYAVSHLPQLELWSGDWQAAERWAREHLDLAERTGQQSQRRQAIYNLALVHAHMGRIEEATREAEEALAEATAAGADWEVWTLAAVLGFAALSNGDLEAAVGHLGRSIAIGARMQDAEPRRQIGDYAEALAAVGQLEEAARMAEAYVSRATSAGNAMLLANALRARAMVAAAEHRLEDAVTAIEAALEAHGSVDVPFDRARTLLAAGQIRRRIGERRAARSALEEARDVFRRLGAPLWERRAADEARRIPIRRSAGEGLTEAEHRAAAMAAEGRSNREIADALFVSVKTVEANLSRVYAKLGVRSRAALASRMTDRGTEGASPKL